MVATFTRPKKTRRKTPPTGPTLARAIGKARMAAPTVSVRVREKAVQNGLVLYPDAGAIEAHCLKCHQDAHGIAFDFKKAWDLIKHPVPGK